MTKRELQDLKRFEEWLFRALSIERQSGNWDAVDVLEKVLEEQKKLYRALGAL